MEYKLKLKIIDSTPDEIKITIPKDGKEFCCETLKLEKPINDITPNSPWSGNLKAKIKRAYIKQLGKSEKIANVIIQEEFYDALMELKDQQNDKIRNAKENETVLEEKLKQEELDKIREDAREFKQFLKEHNATVMDFLEFVSYWLLSGESKNIQTVFFAHFSTLTGLRPIWTIFLGGPGEGKTALEQAGFKLIPRRLKYSGRKTYAVTLNMARDKNPNFLDKRVIGLGDLGGKNSYLKWEETLDVYKELSTDGEYDYSKMEDSIDKETRKKEIIDLKITGHPSVSFASTHSDGLTGQYVSRGVTITPIGSDESVLFYRRFTRPATRAKEYHDKITGPIMDMFHGYIEDLLLKLETFEVINPYYLCLEDWFKDAGNNKRASEMFPLLVDAVTLFNYESRQSIKSPNGKTYYIATKQDNEKIASLFDITPGLTSEVVAFYNKLVDIVGAYDPNEFKDLENSESAITIKQCSTIFTIATLKNQRFRKASQDDKDQFSEFCQLLHDIGKLNVLKKNRKGYNIYHMEYPIEHLGTAEINFDEKRIKEYLDSDMVSSKWGMKLPRDQIERCTEKEIPHNSIEQNFVMPPWGQDEHLSVDTFSEISQKNSVQDHSEPELSK